MKGFKCIFLQYPLLHSVSFIHIQGYKVDVLMSEQGSSASPWPLREVQEALWQPFSPTMCLSSLINRRVILRLLLMEWWDLRCCQSSSGEERLYTECLKKILNISALLGMVGSTAEQITAEYRSDLCAVWRRGTFAANWSVHNNLGVQSPILEAAVRKKAVRSKRGN